MSLKVVSIVIHGFFTALNDISERVNGRLVYDMIDGRWSHHDVFGYFIIPETRLHSNMLVASDCSADLRL